LALPRELLDHAAAAAAREGVVLVEARAEQTPVVQEVGDADAVDLALPPVDDAALHVDQVRRLRGERTEEGHARAGAGLAADEPGEPFGWCVVGEGPFGGQRRERSGGADEDGERRRGGAEGPAAEGDGDHDGTPSGGAGAGRRELASP